MRDFCGSVFDSRSSLIDPREASIHKEALKLIVGEGNLLGVGSVENKPKTGVARSFAV